MQKVIITPKLGANGLGQLFTGEVVSLHPRKCLMSGVGISQGYVVNDATVSESMVNDYCQREFGKTWDEHLHTIGDEVIPVEQREAFLEENEIDDFTDDNNYYTEWSLDGITTGEEVYSDGGETFEAIVLDHEGIMSVINSSQQYMFISLRVQDGERSHTHHCLTQFDNTQNPQDVAENYTKDFWGDSEKIQDGQYEAWGGEVIITLDNYKLITKELYDTLYNLFYSTI